MRVSLELLIWKSRLVSLLSGKLGGKFEDFVVRTEVVIWYLPVGAW
jgi:hypothetical protein